ncbi:hypothetical protein [Nocardioides terrisoli]|uniref:hypothetical protein n=1 Tax=Nocardioides terrisoli TaxID=3388267 RepID=UPI00287B702C|nr:hypothetical protein [Nocardioides marmorisolisilvae]
MRTASAAGLVTLVALTATGCGNPVHLFTGDDPVATYCAAVRHDRRAFANLLAVGSPTALIRDLPMLQALAAKAPDDIADDWQVFLTAVEGLRDALRGAGVAPGAYVDGKPPAGLDRAARRSIAQAADALSSQATVDAAGTVEQEARDVCKVNLGM